MNTLPCIDYTGHPADRRRGSRTAAWLRLQLGVLVLLVGFPAGLSAQQVAGRIVGRVLDAETGRALSGVQLGVQGTSIGTLSGVEGRYVITGVPSGTQSLTVSSLGYGSKTVTGVTVPAGGAVNVDVTLDPSAVALEGVTVTAEREQGTVDQALNEQRTAIGVVNAVTAEQISRSPDGDAAQAVRRVSGVTVQDGKFVFVRGLGERYTTTSLNGARIPSPEPERKVVPLDLFPSGLLQSITTSKTFTPDQPGDFSGAQVNIQTREYPARRSAIVSVSGGFNTHATGQDVLYAPNHLSDWVALGAERRGVPTAAEAAGDFLQPSPSQEELNEIVGSFRNVWSAQRSSRAPNGSVSISVGGSDPLFGRRVGYLASGTYSASQEVQTDEVRGAAKPDTEGNAEVDSRFEGETGRRSVLWGGLLNLSVPFGDRTRIDFNNTYNRTADNEARREEGFTENLGGLPLSIDRLRYVERSVRSNQLVGEHQIGTRHRVDWTLTSSGVTREEPDRSEVVYASEIDPATGERRVPAWFGGSNQGAVRTFADLRENSLAADASYQLVLGNLAHPHRIEIGGLVRSTDRDAFNRAYSVSAPGTLDRDARELQPEQIFDGRFTAPGSAIFTVTPLGVGGSYDAEDRLFAAYGMIEYAPFERVRLITGARVERSEVTVNAQPTTGAAVTSEPTYTDVLPSVALNIALSDAQNLRFSASQTLSRPEYRELAPILYREVIGSESVVGNPDLRRTLIQNYDARWEWYPAAGEILSAGVFAKRFQDPIERVYLATSGTRLVTFLNAEGAKNYGVELEARKGLGSLSRALDPFTAFMNATVMESEIRIGSDVASRTNDQRRMVGQAPYVVNAGLTYTSAGAGTSASLLYNVVGERLVGAAEAPLPDVIESRRQALDLSLRFALRSGVTAKINAKNLLDEPHEVRQGNVTREFYRSGRVFSIGISKQW